MTIDFGQLLLLAYAAEAITENVAWIAEDGWKNWKRLVGLGVSILLSFGAEVDFFAVADVPLKIPFVGYVLTGFLLLRGAVFLHDLIKAISDIRGSLMAYLRERSI